jgi:hypothetical protein
MAINQLPAANYVPAKMPMYLVFPRVDAETDTYARQKFAHTGMDYRIPIGIQGGAWPFGYEVISGPTGLTVGENYGDADYGVVNWPAASVASAGAGPHSVTVRVTDQDGSIVEAVWAIAVDDSQFVFLDSTTGTSGVGTIGDPLKLFTDWYEGSLTYTTYQDKIAVSRAGTYTVTGEGTAGNGNNVDYQPAFKTRSIIGYPGETATLDHGGATAGAKWYLNTEYYDLFVAGLTFYNARQDVNNAHFFWLTNSTNPGGDRVTFHENVFDTCDYGTVGNDNAGPILLSGSGNNTHRENLLLKGNTSTNITPTGSKNGHSLATIFLANYVLVEENIGYGNDVGIAVNSKGTEKFVTIRANNFDNYIQVNLGGEVGPRAPHDHEVCWNKVIIADGLGRGVGNVLALMIASSTTYEGVGGHYNDYIYRNTFKGGSSWVRFAGDELYEVEGNIVEHSANNYNGRWNTGLFKAIATGRENLFVDDIEDGSFNTAFTDASGNLFDDAGNGNARTTYLGTKGAELVLASALATASISTSGNLVVEFSEVVSNGGGGIDDFTIAGRTLSNFVLDASGNTLTADVSPVIEAADADPTVFYTQPTGGLQTVGAVDVASFSVSATNNSTQDNTAPVLSSTTGTTTGSTTATGTVDTDEGSGDIYWLADTSDSTNQSTVLSTGATQAVSGTGTQIVNAVGLAVSTGYYFHFVHKDAAGNDSAVVHSPLFTTDSSAAPTLVNAAINSSGSNLALTFSETVQEAGSESAVTLSNGVTLAAPSGSGTNTLTFGLTPYVQAGETLTVSFAGGANVIEQNGGGVDTEAFAGFAVTNISTATPPAITGTPSINSTGTLLTFFFDDLLNNQTTPIDAPFSLVGGAYTFTGSSLPGTGASFVISPAVQQGDVLTLSFVGTANTFTSTTSALAVESFSGVAITNNSTVVSVPPVFTLAPVVSKTTLTGHTIRQTIDKAGTVYGVQLPLGSSFPTSADVKAGVGSGGSAALAATSVAATAGNPCVLTFSGGAKNTSYDYYIVAEDSVPNLQADVAQVTATTENLLFNGSGGGGLPAAGPKKKVKMKWEESKRKGKR